MTAPPLPTRAARRRSARGRIGRGVHTHAQIAARYLSQCQSGRRYICERRTIKAPVIRILMGVEGRDPLLRLVEER
eukprot:6518135-Pyramimonas_sp.AAC.1